MLFAVLQLLLWSFKYLLLHIKHLPKTWVHIPLTSSPNCCRPQVTSIHGLKDDLFVDNLSKLRELRTRQKHPDNNDGWVLAWRTRCCCGLQWIARLFGAACLRALIIFTFLALIHKGVYILFISQRLVLPPTFYHTCDRKLNFHMSWKLTKYLHYAGLLAGVVEPSLSCWVRSGLGRGTNGVLPTQCRRELNTSAARHQHPALWWLMRMRRRKRRSNASDKQIYIYSSSVDQNLGMPGISLAWIMIILYSLAISLEQCS